MKKKEKKALWNTKSYFTPDIHAVYIVFVFWFIHLYDYL